jgi:hypothetical protein
LKNSKCKTWNIRPDMPFHPFLGWDFAHLNRDRVSYCIKYCTQSISCCCIPSNEINFKNILELRQLKYVEGQFIMNLFVLCCFHAIAVTIHYLQMVIMPSLISHHSQFFSKMVLCAVTCTLQVESQLIPTYPYLDLKSKATFLHIPVCKSQ